MKRQKKTIDNDNENNTGKILCCPLCNEIHSVPSVGVSGYPSPFDLLSLIDKLRETIKTNNINTMTSSSGSLTCCEDNNPAVKRCIECKAVFCDECANRVHSFRALKDHNVVVIDDVPDDSPGSANAANDSNNNLHIIRHCNEHKDEEVKVYCVRDQALVCHLCVTVGRKHAQHECQSLEEASVTLSKVNEELENQINKIHEEMMKFKQKLVVQYEDFKKVWICMFVLYVCVCVCVFFLLFLN